MQGSWNNKEVTKTGFRGVTDLRVVAGFAFREGKNV